MIERRSICMAVVLLTAAAAHAGVAELAKSSGIKGGLVVHLDCGDGRETASLRLDERYLVQGLDTDEATVGRARKNLRAMKLCGPVSVQRFDGSRLPYVDNFVNLIVSTGPTGVAKAEILRVLAPKGVAIVNGRKIAKPWPDEIDEWTHYLHGPGNNAVAMDRVADQPRSIQWVSSPHWGRSHEELASMSATVSAGGRVFFIVDEAPMASIRFVGQWTLVARDAFNGALLWKRPIPVWNDHLRHFRSGPVHLPRRLVAVGDTVYATLGLDAPVAALDAATGKTLRVYGGTEYTEEILVEEGTLYLAAGTSEVSRTGGGLYRRGEPDPTAFRYIAAIEARTGRRLWKKQFQQGDVLLPLTLAVSRGDVVYQSTSGVACLDAASGKQKWQTPRPTPVKRMGFSAPTLVVADGVVLCADRDVDKGAAPADKTVEWGVHGWNVPGFSRKGKSTLRAYDLATGKELWSAACSEGYNSPVDIFVVDGIAWVGSNFVGYDLKTGKESRTMEWKVGNVAMGHHRCYRDKASERFIFTGRSGVEVVSFDKGWIGNNSWIRGTCQYGIMPANGLIYAPPDACGCVPKVKLPGYFAAAPRRDQRASNPVGGPVLEKGPAYETPQSALRQAQGKQSDDWPMYRHDGARSGVAAAAVPAKLTRKWSVELGGKLTQPVAAAGKTFVASVDAHTIHALDSADGRELWSYTAGGRIDSSPTIHKGMVLFGSADGWVYSLRAADGEVIWRFRAAPHPGQVFAFGQLESVWPVHGSVLVQNDTLYVTAGRSTYLDGGIVLYRLNPATGEQISRNVVTQIDPKTDKQTGKEDKQVYGNDMEGSTSDILTGDGESVFLRHLQFDGEGNRTETSKPRLLSVTGLLVEDWFVRTYWLIGTDVQGGWGGWAKAANSAPFGRILSFDDERVYGYGRKAVAGGATGHKAESYHLFSRARTAARSAPQPPAADARKGASGRKKKGASQEAAFVWSNDETPIVRAMVLAANQLIVAGPPNLARKDEKLMAHTNEPEALAGFRGEKGVYLQVFSASDGKKLSETKLTAMPVFDGMSAAGGRLFIALKNGTVECWGR